MTTVDDAVEAGAQVVGTYYAHEYAYHALIGAWPILSAGLRELHRRCTVYDWDGACPNEGEAHTEAHHHEDSVGDWYCDTLPLGLVCDGCRDEDGDRMDWPCPTVRELDRIDKELGL